MMEIAGTHRMRMQLDAAQVYDPCQSRCIVDHDFFCYSARRKRQGSGSQPVRMISRCTFLIKGLAFCSIDKSLQNDRTILDSSHGARRDGQVVTYQLEFGEPGL